MSVAFPSPRRRGLLRFVAENKTNYNILRLLFTDLLLLRMTNKTTNAVWDRILIFMNLYTPKISGFPPSAYMLLLPGAL